MGFDANAKKAAKGPIEVVVELSELELRFLNDYEALLQERKAKK